MRVSLKSGKMERDSLKNFFVVASKSNVFSGKFSRFDL
ncbi:hypothetical protein A33Q_2659 [Indibacter alkaliphilus LW1]|uniref:Uncharacterized protein n=1 Tax=Indibacter alkaliphilus (strain CCUG 57479 / KCTC 22604 / LW1) TaxID=1189612 RepID=S2DVK2_INDAL|nr:hypothetical protein A33Q_2659 [Indibacter alkaliphilus LW1]